MQQSKNLFVYKPIQTELEKKIIFNEFNGKCFIKDDKKMEEICILEIHDNDVYKYIDNSNQERFSELPSIYLEEKDYKKMLEIKMNIKSSDCY